MNATTTTASAPLKGKTKDEPPTQPTLPSHWWNFYALVEQRRRSLFLPTCLLSLDLNSPLIDQSYGRVWPSCSPTKLSLPLLAARSHHQDSSDFHPRPWSPIHQDRMNRPLYSAYHPVRTGCLHTSLVGKYQEWGAFGGLSRLMVGISSNLSASPAVEVLFPLNGWAILERSVSKYPDAFEAFVHLCNSGLPTQAGIHRGFLH
jgi:hypothetical protein